MFVCTEVRARVRLSIANTNLNDKHEKKKKMKKIIIILLCSLLLCTGLSAQEKVLEMCFWRVEDLYDFDESKPEILPEGFQEFNYFASFALGLKTVTVSDSIGYDSSDIDEIILSSDSFGRDCLKIIFNESGKEKLASFTEANIGNHILMEFNGTVIANAKVMEKIYGGSLQISIPESKNIQYQIIQLFECKNEINLQIPEKLIYIKTGPKITEYDNVDKKNLTQLATNFFHAVFEKSDDSYKEYVLPDSQESIAELVEIFRSKYLDCAIQVADTESISSLIIRKFKGKNIPMPLYFYVNNGDYSFSEHIIFMIDKTGELKIKQMTLN